MYFRNSTTSTDEDNLEAFSSEAGVYPRRDAPGRDDEALDAFPVERAPAMARSAPVIPPPPAVPIPPAPTSSAQPHSKVATQAGVQPRSTPGRRRHVGFHWAAATAVLAVCFSVGAGLTHVWLLSLTPETAAPKQATTSVAPNSPPALSGGESARSPAVPSPPATRDLPSAAPAKPPEVSERPPARDALKPEITERSAAPVAESSRPPAAAEPPARPDMVVDIPPVPALGVGDPRADALAGLPSVAAAPPPALVHGAPERTASNERTVTPRVAVPPPPIPAGAGTRPAPSVAPPEEEIRRAINRYQSAYERLDAGAAKEVWPTVDAAALARAFQNLESQDLALSDCRFDVTGTRAQATCRGTARYVRRVGNKAAQQDQRQWLFRLSKDANTWKIDSVQTR